jgi:hypothetical protein
MAASITSMGLSDICTPHTFGQLINTEKWPKKHASTDICLVALVRRAPPTSMV